MMLLGNVAQVWSQSSEGAWAVAEGEMSCSTQPLCLLELLAAQFLNSKFSSQSGKYSLSRR